MAEHHRVDRTELAVERQRFPARLMHLGLRIDAAGRDQVPCVLPQSVR